MRTGLFIDDDLIGSLEDLKRVWHRPDRFD